MRRIVLALFLLAGTVAAASLDIERPIAPRRGGPTSSWQGYVNGASDGKDFLITWSDGRSSYPANASNWPRVGMAQRVDAHGNVLATLTLPIAGQTIWTGSTYVVANDAQYVRVSREGVLLDPTPVSLPVAYLASIASTGSRVLAVTTDEMNTLNATLFDDAMNPLRTMQLAADLGFPAIVAAAADANGFAVFYAAADSNNGMTRLRTIVLDTGGNVVRSFDGMQLPYNISNVKAASDGATFIAVVTTWNPGAGSVLAMAMIDRNTAISMAANPFTDLLVLGKNWIDGTEWALSATPSGYQIVSSRYVERDLTVSLIPVITSGTSSAQMATFVPAAVPMQYALFSNGNGDSLLLWSHKIHGNADADEELFTGQTFASLDDFAVHKDASFRLGDGTFGQESMSAAVAQDGTALVAWRERVDATGRLALYAARLAPDGTILDPDSLRLADATTDGTRPAVVSDGRDFFVAWSEPEQIGIRRIGRDGHLGETSVIMTGAANRTSSPALAWNGSGFLLAFNNREFAQSSTTSIYRYTTQIVRLDAGGAPMGVPAAINPPLQSPVSPDTAWAYSYLAGPRAASDGHDFLVLYTKRTMDPSPSSRTLDVSAVTRVTAAGAVTSADMPIVLEAARALFWSGKSYVAVEDALGGFYGVRISADGLPLDGLPGGGPETSGPLLPGYPNPLAVQPLCDATGCYAAGLMARDGTTRLFSWRVTDADGAFDRTEPAPAATVTTPFLDGSGAIALPGATPRIVYSRVAPEPEFLDVIRIFVRTPKPLRRRAAR